MSKMTQSEFAKRHGVSRQYIGQLVKSGLIEWKDGLIEAENADEIIELKKSNKKYISNPNTNALQLELLKAQVQNMKYRSSLLENKLKREYGEIVSLEDVEKQAFKTARTVRDHMLNIPDRICHQLLGLDAVKTHETLSKEIRLALEALINLENDEFK